jgi:hypothetical protein
VRAGAFAADERHGLVVLDRLVDAEAARDAEKIDRRQSLKVVVGTRASAASDGTGSRVFAAMCVVEFGKRERTWRGPVRSSWVRFGKSTKPICNPLMDVSTSCASSPRAGRSGRAGLRRGRWC